MSLQSFVIETTEASHCQHLDHHDPWSSWSSLLPQRIKTKNSWCYEEFRLVMMINNLWDLWNIQRSSPLVRLQHSWACGSLQDLPHGQPWWRETFLHSNSCTLGLLPFQCNVILNDNQNSSDDYVRNIANIDHLEITFSAPHDLVSHDNHRIAIIMIMISSTLSAALLFPIQTPGQTSSADQSWKNCKNFNHNHHFHCHWSSLLIIIIDHHHTSTWVLNAWQKWDGESLQKAGLSNGLGDLDCHFDEIGGTIRNIRNYKEYLLGFIQ